MAGIVEPYYYRPLKYKHRSLTNILLRYKLITIYFIPADIPLHKADRLFGANVQQGKALEHNFVPLNNTVHIAMPTKIYLKPQSSPHYSVHHTVSFPARTFVWSTALTFYFHLCFVLHYSTYVHVTAQSLFTLTSCAYQVISTTGSTGTVPY